MKHFLGLIFVAGLLAAGWLKRDALTELWAKSTAPSESESAPADDLRASAATPHPAREAQAQAMAIYPGLTLPDSALNRKFVALYKESQQADPALLSRPNWPLVLAERAVVSLGGAPLPRGTPATAAAAAPTREGKQVVIYTTSSCPACKTAKSYMRKKGIRFREIDVESSLGGREEFRKMGGSSVPIITVGDKKMVGFSAQELERLLL